MSGDWTVWGDGVDPIASDLDRDAARSLVDQLTASGREDVYAEDAEGEEYPHA